MDDEAAGKKSEDLLFSGACFTATDIAATDRQATRFGILHITSSKSGLRPAQAIGAFFTVGLADLRIRFDITTCGPYSDSLAIDISEHPRGVQ